MTYGDAFITEVTVNFEHTFEAAHNQTLQRQLRRDTQVHIHIQRVVMGDERTGRRAAGDHLHHRGFDFHKAAAHHELAHRREDLRTDFKRASGCVIGDQIQVALTVTDFLILQTVEFVRQRAQRFGQQTQLSAVDEKARRFGF